MKYKMLLTFGGLGLAGALIGGFIGFLMRPSFPVVGQLPFPAVITRGSILEEVDRLFLAPIAQTSFNYLLLGIVIGAILGIALAFALKKSH